MTSEILNAQIMTTINDAVVPRLTKTADKIQEKLIANKEIANIRVRKSGELNACRIANHHLPSLFLKDSQKVLS